jgi:hypothetical protein
MKEAGISPSIARGRLYCINSTMPGADRDGPSLSAPARSRSMMLRELCQDNYYQRRDSWTNLLV